MGISTLETALGSLMGLVRSGAIDLPTLVARLTSGPASVLGDRFNSLASLAVGTPADIVLFDPEEALDGGRWPVRVQGEEHAARRAHTAGQSEDDDRGWRDSLRGGWSVTAAYLVLSDGTVYEGYAFGAERDAFGEVVFNTSMSGYQEMLTDPSYAGQILVPTYPMQGNYGINGADVESKDIKVAAFVVREHSSTPSHYDSSRTLHTYLADEGIPGIRGVDTRGDNAPHPVPRRDDGRGDHAGPADRAPRPGVAAVVRHGELRRARYSGRGVRVGRGKETGVSPWWTAA